MSAKKKLARNSKFATVGSARFAAMEPLEERRLLSLIGVVPQFPLMGYDNTGSLAYHAATQSLDIQATALTLKQSPASPARTITQSAGGFQIHIMVDNAGNLVGGVPGDDLTVQGSIDLDGNGTIDASGTLLTGEILKFGYKDVGATDSYDFRFTVTGGALANLYSGDDLGIVLSSEASTFTGSFATDFTGHVKGNLGGIVLPPPPILPASLGDYVWEDLNADGIQNDGNTGITGVSVKLTGAGTDGTFGTADDVTATTTTDSSGFYTFTNLTPGSYYETFTAPGGYLFTASQGANPALDSNANPVTGQTATITLASGQNDMTQDAGLYRPSSLGDYVWEDLNADGIQNDGGTGIAGVAVKLTGAGADGTFGTADDVTATTTTNSSGFYTFTNLTPGSYYETFTAPGGYQFSQAGQGANATLDSNANPVTGQTAIITLVSGQNDMTQDAGLYRPASLGDYVWEDLNADGIQNDGNTGIAGVSVKLTGAGADGTFGTADDVTATTTTDSSGHYQFNSLVPGNYYVSFTAPGGYLFSPAGQGVNPALDSNANPATGQAAAVTLVSGQSDMTQDAGLYRLASLGDYVWHDMYQGPSHPVDGVQDASEPGIGGVTVNLLDGAGNFLASTTTDGSGFYQFAGLLPGTYDVEVASGNFQDGGALAGWYATLPNQGADASLDSNGDAVSHRSAAVTLISGQYNPTIDFGFFTTGIQLVKTGPDTARVGDTISYHFIVENIGDVAMAGGTEVSDAMLNPAGDNQVWTGSLQPGQAAEFDIAYMPTSVGSLTNTAGVVGLPVGPDGAVLSPVSDASSWTVDVQARPNALPGSLGDYVWHDMYHSPTHLVDGIQDAGEPGIAGVVVDLLDGTDAELESTTTDADGYYQFNGLPAGTYIVEVAPENFQGDGVLTGWYATLPNQGVNDAVDSDGDMTTNQSGPVTVAAGQNNPTVDFGFFTTGIDLIKSGPATINLGDTITYHFHVVNTGDVVLHGGAHVYDAMLNPCGDHEIWSGVLQPGQSVDFDKTYKPASTGKLVNTSNAVGHPIRPDNFAMPLVSDTSSCTVDVIRQVSAMIDLEKYVKAASAFQGTEGLTPGYWKQCQHQSSWTGYKTTDRFNTVFGVSAPGNMTLLSALQAGGGGAYALMRQAAAALLNAASTGLDYAYDRSEVIALVQNAFATGNYDNTQVLLATQNEKEGSLCGGKSAGSFGDAADQPTGPSFQVGQQIVFTYAVTNPGKTALANVVVTDDNETPGKTSDDFHPVAEMSGGYNVGDTDHDGLLDAGEKWLYSAATAVTTGQHVNVATVVGTPVDGKGARIAADVSDSDPAYWLGAAAKPGGCGQTSNKQGICNGFWTQSQDFKFWTGCKTTDSFDKIFGVKTGGGTMLDVLKCGKGNSGALMQQAVTALLNAGNSHVNYAYSKAQVIAVVREAFESGDYDSATSLFTKQNNLGGADLLSSPPKFC